MTFLSVNSNWLDLFGFNASATARVISRRGNDDDEISYLVEETGVPGGNHRPTASNWWNFSLTLCLKVFSFANVGSCLISPIIFSWILYIPRPRTTSISGPRTTGRGNNFFLGGGGGKNVDMPTDCQNLGGGGTEHIHPIETKSLGPLAPPPAPAPLP